MVSAARREGENDQRTRKQAPVQQVQARSRGILRRANAVRTGVGLWRRGLGESMVTF